MAPTSALALHGLWWLVSEPLITPPDQNFALRHASIIHPDPTPQGNPYPVTFRVFRVTGLRVIGADGDRNRLALSSSRLGPPAALLRGIFDFIVRLCFGFGVLRQ